LFLEHIRYVIGATEKTRTRWEAVGGLLKADVGLEEYPEGTTRGMASIKLGLQNGLQTGVL